MQADIHKRLCLLGDISSWLHPLRSTADYQSLSKPQQNRLLSLQYQLRLPRIADISGAPGSDFIACWAQLPRLCLLAGSLGLIGVIHAERQQSLYQPGDLLFISALSQQCFPVMTHIAGGMINEAVLCERGWLALCHAFTLPDELARAGALGLPPSPATALPPLEISLRVCLSLSKILHYLQGTLHV